MYRWRKNGVLYKEWSENKKELMRIKYIIAEMENSRLF